MKKYELLLILMITGLILSFGSNLAYGAATYSKEELVILNKIGIEIEKENCEAIAMGVEKVVSSTISFKFDTPPILFQDRTLVPIRAIAESLGASVTWEPVKQKIVVEKDAKKVILYINDNRVISDDKEKTIDVAAKILSSRTYVPLRFIVEEYGLEIDYDSKTGVITISE